LFSDIRLTFDFLEDFLVNKDGYFWGYFYANNNRRVYFQIISESYGSQPDKSKVQPFGKQVSMGIIEYGEKLFKEGKIDPTNGIFYQTE
jgi:hypothetical protein